MLSRKYRATRPEVEQVIKTGTTVSGNLFYAKISREAKEMPKFAIVISKKIEKTSAGRHLLKRRISSVIEKKISDIKTKKIAIFFPKKINERINYKKIKKDISSIIDKINSD